MIRLIAPNFLKGWLLAPNVDSKTSQALRLLDGQQGSLHVELLYKDSIRVLSSSYRKDFSRDTHTDMLRTRGKTLAASAVSCDQSTVSMTVVAVSSQW